jgi:hypothetical protein
VPLVVLLEREKTPVQNVPLSVGSTEEMNTFTA